MASLTLTTPLLILAGGLGTRLGDHAKKTPKYLMPVGPSTFADHHLQWVRNQGFQDVILSIGHLGNQIQDHIQDGSKWGLNVVYLEDGEQPIGTGGAVRKSLFYSYSNLAITYGDTLLSFSAKAFLEDFLESGLKGGMTVFRNPFPEHPSNCDFDGQLVHYNKKSPSKEMKFIDYGFLVLKREAIESFITATPLDLALPLGFLSRIGQVFGYEVKERFWEIGSPEALEEFKKRIQY